MSRLSKIDGYIDADAFLKMCEEAGVVDQVRAAWERRCLRVGDGDRLEPFTFPIEPEAATMMHQGQCKPCICPRCCAWRAYEWYAGIFPPKD